VRREGGSAERGCKRFDIVVCCVVCVPTGRSFVARRAGVVLRAPKARRLHDGNGRQRSASRPANDEAADEMQAREKKLSNVELAARAVVLSSWRLELAMLAGQRLWVQGSSFGLGV